MAGGAETPKYRSVARHRSLPSTPTGHGYILRHSSSNSDGFHGLGWLDKLGYA